MSTVIYTTGVFEWTYTHTSGDLPETYRIKYGMSPGVYASYTIVPYGTNTVPVRTVLPDTGIYYVQAYTYNTAYGELNASGEIEVVATVTPRCVFTT